MEKDKASSACQFERTIVLLRDNAGEAGRPCPSSFQHICRHLGLLPGLDTGPPVNVKGTILGGDWSRGSMQNVLLTLDIQFCKAELFSTLQKRKANPGEDKKWWELEFPLYLFCTCLSEKGNSRSL